MGQPTAGRGVGGRSPIHCSAHKASKKRAAEDAVGVPLPVDDHHDDVTQRVRNIQKIEMGRFVVDTWYFSPYPEEYANVDVLFMCEFCLKVSTLVAVSATSHAAWQYMKRKATLQVRMGGGGENRHPPVLSVLPSAAPSAKMPAQGALLCGVPFGLDLTEHSIRLATRSTATERSLCSRLTAPR